MKIKKLPRGSLFRRKKNRMSVRRTRSPPRKLTKVPLSLNKHRFYLSSRTAKITLRPQKSRTFNWSKPLPTRKMRFCPSLMLQPPSQRSTTRRSKSSWLKRKNRVPPSTFSPRRTSSAAHQPRSKERRLSNTESKGAQNLRMITKRQSRKRVKKNRKPRTREKVPVRRIVVRTSKMGATSKQRVTKRRPKSRS